MQPFGLADEFGLCPIFTVISSQDKVGEFTVPTCALQEIVALLVFVGKKQASDVLVQCKITLGEQNA